MAIKTKSKSGSSGPSSKRTAVAKRSSSRSSAATGRKAATPKRAAASSGSRSRKKSSGASSRTGGRNLSQTTIDHEQIREWAEERGAHPACVKRTGGKGDPGMIRLDFPGYSGRDSLQPISWDEWFEAFDDNGLALVYQDKTASGQRSNFNKLVSRDSM